MRIGKFELREVTNVYTGKRKIWIGIHGDESDEFSEAKLEKVIEKFYNENL